MEMVTLKAEIEITIDDETLVQLLKELISKLPEGTSIPGELEIEITDVKGKLVSRLKPYSGSKEG